jgi:hypothetical protein
MPSAIFSARSRHDEALVYVSARGEASRFTRESKDWDSGSDQRQRLRAVKRQAPPHAFMRSAGRDLGETGRTAATPAGCPGAPGPDVAQAANARGSAQPPKAIEAPILPASAARCSPSP